MACPEITEDIKYIHKGALIDNILYNIHSAVKKISLTTTNEKVKKNLFFEDFLTFVN